MQLDEDGDLEKFCVDVKNVQEQLKACGVDINDEIAACVILNGLPQSFDVMRRIIEIADTIEFDQVEAALWREFYRSRR